MTSTIEEIFTPSTGVEIVLNLNSLNPVTSTSIIYDANHAKRHIVLAQPLRSITPSTSFDEMHLTTLLKVDHDKKRLGIKCKPIAFHKDYYLNDKTKVGALTIEYSSVLIDANIRTAYRMPMSGNFTVKAKLIFKSNNYYSKRDFFIKDVSISGLGMTIPVKLNNAINPLTQLERNSKAVIGMLLMIPNSKQPFATIPLKIEVVRINRSYSENHIFIGVKFIGLTPDKELQLNKFIHMAQLDEIRRLSKLDVL